MSQLDRLIRLSFGIILSNMISVSFGTWLVLANFNALLINDERVGRMRVDPTNRHVKVIVDELGIIDLCASGVDFTWSHRCVVSKLIRYCVDRGMENADIDGPYFLMCRYAFFLR